jgi:uncharacterized protein (TIGR02757 family)
LGQGQFLNSEHYLKLKETLDPIVAKVNHLDFIENDPISVPHRFVQKEDIEIAGFFSAIFAWGNRKTIINKANELMTLMDNSPYEFILHHKDIDLKVLMTFKHRTFQSTDLLFFIQFFRKFYSKNESLEQAFYPDHSIPYSQKDALIHFHNLIFEGEEIPDRSRKHIATPAKNATCKRLNMLLRWMVRSDENNVDFGIWKSIPMSALMIPLDVHVENYARKFGLLTRQQRDWKAVEEITNHLRWMNPNDPVIYDYALFGLGVSLNKCS